MNTETMTIHKALAELKTLDARIRKEISSTTFVTCKKASASSISGIAPGDWCAQVVSTYQSIEDLIRRRNAIKRAVVLSNATTTVVVAGKEYTVAEAIELKNTGMSNISILATKISRDLNMSQKNCESENERLEDRAMDYVRTLFGNVSDVKNISNDMAMAKEDFMRTQEVQIVDPIKSFDKIKSLNEEYDSFMVDVDAALSVSNSITNITIEY